MHVLLGRKRHAATDCRPLFDKVDLKPAVAFISQKIDREQRAARSTAYNGYSLHKLTLFSDEAVKLGKTRKRTSPTVTFCPACSGKNEVSVFGRVTTMGWLLPKSSFTVMRSN